LVDTNILIIISSLITSIPWIVVIYTLYYTPEKLEKWLSMIYRSLSWASKKYEKRGISGDITSDIKSFKRKYNDKKLKFLPYDIKINWLDEDTRESFISKNKVVIRMKYNKNQSRNVMHATLLYIESGLLPNTKNFIDNTVRRASELVLTEKILIEEQRHGARQLLENEVIDNEIKQNSTLDRYINILKKLDSNGTFTRIFLKELSFFGEKVSNLIPNTEIRKETVEFIKELERFSTRKKGEFDSPGYTGNYIKTSIVLIAKQETYLLYGIQPYIRYINRSLDEGIDTFYMCAISDPNIVIVNDILEGLEKHPNLIIENKETYNISKYQRAINATLKKINR
jgi:hypothetical protein